LVRTTLFLGGPLYTMSILTSGVPKVAFFLCSLFLFSAAKLIAQIDISQGLGTDDLRLRLVPDTLFRVDTTFLDSTTLMSYIGARAKYPSYYSKRRPQVTESFYSSAETIVWITREFGGSLHQRVIRSFHRRSNDDPFVEYAPAYASRGFMEQVGVYPYQFIKNKFLRENDCPRECVRDLSTTKIELACAGPDSVEITRFAVIEVPEKGKGYGKLERRISVKAIDDITEPFIPVGWYANSVQYYCNCEEKD
jgi:hypothetical protein